MNFVHLQSFLATAETLNFTKAAEALFISQSTLSRHIALLEEELGVVLLSRDRHNVSLTSAGELLFEEGKGLISKINTIERRLKSLEHPEEAKLDIICSPMFSPCFTDIYTEYTRLYPNAACSISQIEWGLEESAILRDEADLSFKFWTNDIKTDELCWQLIRKEKLCLICGLNSHLAKKESLTLSDFSNETLLMSDAPVSEWLTDIHYKLAGNFKDIRHMKNLHSTILELRSGRGVALWPKSVVADTQTFSRVLPVSDFDQYTDFIAIWAKGNANPEIKHFLDAWRALLRRSGRSVS